MAARKEKANETPTEMGENAPVGGPSKPAPAPEVNTSEAARERVSRDEKATERDGVARYIVNGRTVDPNGRVIEG